MNQEEKMEEARRKKILVKNLNPVISCKLCGGYFINATTLVDCLHNFCRGCILRHFENGKTSCPICNTVYKKKSQTCFRSDQQIQTLVYKLVPSLYAKEMQRREDFYRSTGVRASSSCSDDSVIEREREINDQEEDMIDQCQGVKTEFFSPEDSISLSLEYYQHHLDMTDTKGDAKCKKVDQNPKTENVKVVKSNSERIGKKDSETTTKSEVKPDSDPSCAKSDGSGSCGGDKAASGGGSNDAKLFREGGSQQDCDKRYLRCPAGVSMKHLQKFIRMKFGLTADHRVDIIYSGEVLPMDFTLMDVAYTFKWKRIKPMRFFYQIFTPLKVKPIKIVNTILSTGGKRLQIVPVKPNPDPPKLVSLTMERPDQVKVEPAKAGTEIEETEDQKNHKERLFAHLQLQSRAQAEKNSQQQKNKAQSQEKVAAAKDCVYEYEEPSPEEMRIFAENRDREWAMQKKKDAQNATHHFGRKRKKSKHSKSEFNVHKKRFHAEIASNEEELKLKVKITNNGHKHKHHKNSNDKNQPSETSSKEKLLHLRQVRHKQAASEDKNVQTMPTERIDKDSDIAAENPAQNVKENGEAKRSNEGKRNPLVFKPEASKLKLKVNETLCKVSESATLPKQQTESSSTSPKVGAFLEPLASKQGFSLKNAVDKEWPQKNPTVQLERHEMTEKQAQRALIKTFTPSPLKTDNNPVVVKVDNNVILKPLPQPKPIPVPMEKTTVFNTNNKNLDRKIANLQQRCTVEAKQPEKNEKKVSFADKPKVVAPHYPPGFTVSKIEQGVKRKAETNEKIQEKRPSLEITLINPPVGNQPQPQTQTKPAEKPAGKRPPPATIPLERIKKSNLKSGISIIPKMPATDNIGALDLSKTSKSPDNSPKPSPKSSPKSETNSNGFGRSITFQKPQNSSAGSEKNNMALSNLQMLSKVATEHSILKTTQQQQQSQAAIGSKPRPQMPSLQTLRIPNMQNAALKAPGNPPNLQRLPKLNEIGQQIRYRLGSPQIRNLRPNNQNQNIRNIPNPSLLIRQQNQNRLNQNGGGSGQQNKISGGASDAVKTQQQSGGAANVALASANSGGNGGGTVKNVADCGGGGKVQEMKEIVV